MSLGRTGNDDRSGDNDDHGSGNSDGGGPGPARGDAVGNTEVSTN